MFPPLIVRGIYKIRRSMAGLLNVSYKDLEMSQTADFVRICFSAVVDFGMFRIVILYCYHTVWLYYLSSEN